MRDAEAQYRRRVIELLGEACDCQEEAPVQLRSGEQGRVDVLARPRREDLADLTIAFEVKAPSRAVGDAKLGEWLVQAATYVGARPVQQPAIVAAFVWLVDVHLSTDPAELLRMDGMRMVMQHLRTGVAAIGRKGGLVLVLGPSCEIYNERAGGWRAQAGERLRARRIEGGSRRSPMT